MSRATPFRDQYAAALRTHLATRSEASLAVGHELGRRALQERVSMLEIIESHFLFVDALTDSSGLDGAAALQFLLQTLAALDVATRGFLDGTRRYEQQRARADDLASRDEFRTALVNSLQEGFFVADHDGAVVEINDAFVQITGYGPAGLPYRPAYPWIVDPDAAGDRRRRLEQDGHVEAEIPVRHREGHITWVAITVNAVQGADRHAYVGTIRDINATRAASVREGAVVRLATAVSVATSVAQVLSIALDECRTALDVRRVVAVVWPPSGAEPTIQVAGDPADSAWSDLDPFLRNVFEDARHRLPLTVEPVGSPDDPGKSRGIVAVLSGSGDVELWLEHSAPRRVSTEDRLLIAALVGHLSLAMQHVRQFEAARDTSLTLQRTMLPSHELPPGFAVRYEPAVPPLEIGGDWYDVLPAGDHRIGIIVGDCVGRGLPAAAVMGQLRSSARALLLTGAEPALLLEQLDAAAALIPDAMCTTVFVAVLDTESAILHYSSAGHLPALLATPRSGASRLTEALSVPLAVGRDHPRPLASRPVPPGSTLMLYTDGLVERRHAPIDHGIARVAGLLTKTMNLGVEAVADAMLREMAPPRGYDDDVAIVVWRQADPPLRIESDADANRLADLRHELADWLRRAATPDGLVYDIVLAVNEACTNCVEHGYRGRRPGKMRVEADIDGSEIHVRVIDHGTWKTPAAHPRTRGRGFLVIQEVSDRVDVNHTAAGTTIDLTFSVPTKDRPS